MLTRPVRSNGIYYGPNRGGGGGPAGGGGSAGGGGGSAGGGNGNTPAGGNGASAPAAEPGPGPLSSAPTERERPGSLTLSRARDLRAEATSPTAKMTRGHLFWLVIPGVPRTMPFQFNPSELKISKEVSWDGKETPSFNAPILQFGGGKSASYSVSLIFDAYAHFNPDNVKNGSQSPVYDVRVYTNQLLRLTMRNEGFSNFLVPYLKPPIVQFVWGSLRMFWAVITKVEITYIMFAQDGRPIRAKADVEFTQQDPSEDLLPAQNPTSRSDPRRTRIAHSYQRLDLIAHEEYGDSRFWRLLAEANHLDDPFQLQDGQMLIIPEPNLAHFG